MQLQSQNEQDTSADAYIALIYVGLGDYDEAMLWLNRAYDARFKASILLHPAFDALRSDARFQDLLRRSSAGGPFVQTRGEAAGTQDRL